MAEGERRKAGCVKLGCFGCAGVALLTVLIFGTLIGVGALVGRPEPRVEQSSLEQPLPPGPGQEPVSGPTTDIGTLSLPPGGIVPEVDEPGRVILDLSMGDFEVVAGDEPGPIRIESDFDTSIFELKADFERYGESGWTYHVRLERKVAWYRLLFGEQDQNIFVRVILPPEVPLSLEGKLGMGEARMSLGGLWLVDTDLVASMGEITVDYDRPLLAPMKSFRLVSKMGEAQVSNLGNASPSSVYVRHRMGSMSLGLQGAWQNDARVEGGITMGELVVWVPEDVLLDVENMSQVIGEANVFDPSKLQGLDEDAPTLKLDLRGGMGSIEVRRR